MRPESHYVSKVAFQGDAPSGMRPQGRRLGSWRLERSLTGNFLHETIGAMKIPKELTTVTPLSKILAAILFITLPFIGFFLGVRYQEMLDLTKSQESEENLTISRAPTPTPMAIPTLDPSITANWKTYKNEKYGFSFKYPASLTLREQGVDYSYTLEVTKYANEPGIQSLDYIYVAIMATKNPYNDYLHHLEEANLLIDSFKIGETKNIKPNEPTGGFRQSNVFQRLPDKKVNSLPVQIFLRDNLLGGPADSYEKRAYIIKNDYVYYIRGYMVGGEVTDTLFDQILSAFQFSN